MTAQLIRRADRSSADHAPCAAPHWHGTGEAKSEIRRLHCDPFSQVGDETLANLTANLRRIAVLFDTLKEEVGSLLVNRTASYAATPLEGARARRLRPASRT